ncbi:uncharacterized protein LOC122077839 [Macadamia integrifolia]|uniref:uncharacterized protein LOC122077839 n=1 Tax=Macadamia integrifolia TaxID=60698 RepID=UPI001C4F7B0B|nr:uncharacterized protein LOC122077839 [Macadamia integrifolia]
MALLCSLPHLSNPHRRRRTSASNSYRSCRTIPNFYNPRNHSPVFLPCRRTGGQSRSIISSHLCTPETITLDRSALDIAEAVSEEELWAAACLRIRSFHEFRDSYGIEDHRKYLAEREFEALKERIAGTRIGFKRVSCINATLPLSKTSIFSDDLRSTLKFSANGGDRVVVGSLDLNQCLRLPDEITGEKPEGIGADFARAYLSNVCVAKELHRNGVASALVAKSKRVAEEWGITDLYVHVAVDNEPAKKLYMKSGFIYENDEPAWQARFLDRPRRMLLWIGLPSTDNL